MHADEIFRFDIKRQRIESGGEFGRKQLPVREIIPRSFHRGFLAVPAHERAVMLDEVVLVVARDDCRFGHGEYEPREPQLVRPLAQDVAEHEKSVAAREPYLVHQPAEQPVLSVYVRNDIIHTPIITQPHPKINTLNAAARRLRAR